METIFTVTNQDLQRFSPQEAVEVFRELLWAEARRVGLPLNRVHVSSWINVPDGGVDATVDAEDVLNSETRDGLIKVGDASYQIKASDSFSPWQDSEIRNELFGRNQPTGIEHLGKSVRDCLDSGGTYVLVCFRQDFVESQRTQAIAHLESYFSQCGYLSPKVEVWGMNNLIGFISSFPSLALRVNGHDRAEFQSHRNWSRQDLMLPPLISDESHQSIIDGIQNELRKQGESVHVRIVGEAGIGKTKIALEATRADDLAPLVLYCNAEKFLNSNLMNHLLREDNHFSSILVLDECDEENRALVWNQLKHIGPRIKIISISNEYAATRGNIAYFEIPPLDSEAISSIIQRYNIPKDLADRYVFDCGGSPRVAHHVGQSLSTESSSLSDMLLSADTVNIWDRFIVGRDKADSEATRQRVLVLRYLALFKKFGYKHAVAAEAQSIAQMIAKANPSITWARFQEIISELKRRKIVQGEYTLYLTPRLLHVKLWVDWWETHGTGFDLEEFSENLPPRLLEWFYEMFAYAQTSPAASRTVKWLLSAEGPFQDTDFLNSKLGGDFFLALSKAEPKAALNCLWRTIGTWNKEELLSFDAGRRQVVWALENIAVWKDLFADATRLLLKLGEAENEQYSNNASGVFVDLFSMAWGEVAPTEASPQVKIPILREALESGSKEQISLAFKACEKALETDHFARTIGTSHIPLQRTPNRWMPKTYGEWFDGYRAVWRLIEEKLEALSEDQGKRAATLLLNHAGGVGRIPALSEMVIETIRGLLRKGYIDQLDLIEFLSRFLHKKNELQAEVRQQWESLRNEVTPRDFPSLMKRYVALDLLFDKFDDEERYVDQAQPKIEELAQQSVENPGLLKPELEWLTTIEAKRGYDFGFALGVSDSVKGFSLLPILIQAQRESLRQENASAFFLGGYFRALHRADENLWEQVLDILTQIDDLKILIPELTFRGGITERAAQRIVNLAERGEISFGHFRLFEYGIELLRITANTFHRWVEFLLSVNDLYAVCICINLMSLYYLRGPNPEDGQRPPIPKDITFKVLTHDSLFVQSDKPADQMSVWNWGTLANRYVDLYPDEGLELAKVILRNFGEDGPVFADLERYPQSVLDKVARTNPFELWKLATQYLGPPIDTRAWRVKEWLHEGGIDFGKSPSSDVVTIPLETLWAWVDEDVEERAWYLATIVPSVLYKSENSTCLARELLVRYGHREDVRRNLHANFGNEMWWGSASEHYKNKKQWLLDYRQKEDHPNVLRWIDEYIEQIDTQIEMFSIHEERQF